MLNYRESALIRFIARRRDLTTHTPGHIDTASFGEPNLVNHTSSSDVPRGGVFVVTGWTVDLGRRRAPWDVRVEIDGKEVPARVRLKLPRPDIAALIGSREALLSGFTAFVDTGSLAVGPHDLTVRAIVGRYGTAFAKIPENVRFFIVNQYAPAFAPPSRLERNSGACYLERIPIVAHGSVLELSGWALDDRGRPFAGVAAQIDELPWNEGWTGIGHAAAVFRIRIRLDTIAAGSHSVQLAAKSVDGHWQALGERRPLTVTNVHASLPSWPRALIEGGEAEITDRAGCRLSELELYRLGAALPFDGILRRSTAVGRAVSLIARDSDKREHSIPTWSVPTADPKALRFGGEIPPRLLKAGIYRLLVDASDASQRYVGRADTACDLMVRRTETRQSRRSLDRAP